MKMLNVRTRFYLLSAVLIAGFVFSQAHAQAPCSELFITEIYAEKNPNLDPQTQLERPFDINFAVEIFNPTPMAVNLSDYSLELNVGSSVTSIPLSSAIGPKVAYVVGNVGAGINLQTLADTVVPYLDFSTATMLTLRHNGVAIDRIGQDGDPTPDNFDVEQFILDPINYLNSYHFDLYDYHNLNARRSMFVDRGDTLMSSASELLGNWAYFPTNDMSDLGQYTGVCNNPLGNDIIGYWVDNFGLSACNPNTFDPLDLICNGTKNGSPLNSNCFIAHEQVSGSTAQIRHTASSCLSSGPLLKFSHPTAFGSSGAPQSSCSSATWNYNPGVTSNVSARLHNLYAPGANCLITLKAVSSSGISIDAARSMHNISIDRCLSVRPSPDDLSVDIYPTSTHGKLNVTCKNDLGYVIADITGRIILTGNVNGNRKSLDVAGLTPGQYLIKFSSNDVTTVKRFTKQ